MPVRPSNPEQFARHERGELPEADEFRPGVWSIPVPFRTGIPYSLCYVVIDARGNAHIIDPGFDTKANREHLVSRLARIGVRIDSIASVVTTHFHHDHLGLAHWLSETTGLPVAIHEADATDLESGAAAARFSNDTSELGERWGVPAAERHRLRLSPAVTRALPSVRARPLIDGESLDIPGREVRVVHTPGHTRGHCAFVLADEGIILTGDHVLPATYPGLGLGGLVADDDPIGAYLRSLDRLGEFDNDEVAPGHDFRFHGLAERRRELAGHVLTRAQKVEVAMELYPDASTWFIASTLTWKGGIASLEGHLLQSALSQTRMYANFIELGGLHAFA